MAFTFTFLVTFFYVLWLAMPLLLVLAGTVVVLGQWVGRREGWKPFDSLYWAFITATTVGYGDIRPKGRLSRFLSVMIAFVGLIFTGIMVSVAVEVTSYSFKKHGHIEEARQDLEQLEANRLTYR